MKCSSLKLFVFFLFGCLCMLSIGCKAIVGVGAYTDNIDIVDKANDKAGEGKTSILQNYLNRVASYKILCEDSALIFIDIYNKQSDETEKGKFLKIRENFIKDTSETPKDITTIDGAYSEAQKASENFVKIIQYMIENNKAIEDLSLTSDNHSDLNTQENLKKQFSNIVKYSKYFIENVDRKIDTKGEYDWIVTVFEIGLKLYNELNGTSKEEQKEAMNILKFATWTDLKSK